MTTVPRFDDALPLFAAIVAQYWGADALPQNLFLRDAAGKLTFVVLDPHRTPDQRSELGKAAANVLGPYTENSEFAVLTPAELFDDTLGNGAELAINLKHESYIGTIRLLDRRAVGADWLRGPAQAAGGTPRLVFATLKGGVGRSTALAVLAADIASRGGRVLAIDLDLEAPGIGTMLLESASVPKFGVLDYLVENGVGEVDTAFYIDMVGSSWVGRGRGRVDVLPAIGKRSQDNAADVLGKIARAYLEKRLDPGSSSTFLDHVRFLIDRFATPPDYDCVLIDARAGLHETTAGPLLGLGAEVFLFGSHHPQTFTGYKFLLSHLARFPVEQNNDWRERLTMIHAKSRGDPDDHAIFTAKCRDLFQQSGIVRADHTPAPPEVLDPHGMGGYRGCRLG